MNNREKAGFWAICIFLAWSSVRAGEQDTSINLSVYGFKAIGVSMQLASSLQEQFESEILQFKRFKIISRSNLDLILRENGFSMSGACSDEACLAQAGSLAGIEKIVTGTISRVGATYNVVLKLISVRSGRIEASANRQYTGDEDGLLDISKDLLKDLLRSQDVLPAVSLAVKDTGRPVEKSQEKNKEPVAIVQEQTVAELPLNRPAISSKTIGRGAISLFGTVCVVLLLSQIFSSHK
jgi:hypothetical protein